MFEVDWSTQVQQPKYHYHVSSTPSPWTQQPHTHVPTTPSTAEHFWAVPPLIPCSHGMACTGPHSPTHGVEARTARINKFHKAGNDVKAFFKFQQLTEHASFASKFIFIFINIH